MKKHEFYGMYEYQNNNIGYGVKFDLNDYLSCEVKDPNKSCAILYKKSDVDPVQLWSDMAFGISQKEIDAGFADAYEEIVVKAGQESEIMPGGSTWNHGMAGAYVSDGCSLTLYDQIGFNGTPFNLEAEGWPRIRPWSAGISSADEELQGLYDEPISSFRCSCNDDTWVELG